MVNPNFVSQWTGKHEPQPEPEPLDLPEDLNLDDEQKDGGEEDKNEENPFDIDEMKGNYLYCLCL